MDLIAIPSVPYIDEPLTYVHDHSSSETFNIEVDVSLIKESRVHALSVFYVESHSIPLSLYELLPTTLPHVQIDKLKWILTSYLVNQV